MSSIDVQITGYAQAVRMLTGLPEPLRYKIMAYAVNKAVRPLVTMARTNARRRSGALAKSIANKVKTYKRSGVTVAVVGPTFQEWKYKGQRIVPGYYAHLVEGGTSKRGTRGMNRKLERAKSRMRIWTGTEWADPPATQFQGGARAYPFLRPAYDATRSQVEDLMATEVAAGIAREADKLGAK
jgi:HK97 gp10 family phage protein